MIGFQRSFIALVLSTFMAYENLSNTELYMETVQWHKSANQALVAGVITLIFGLGFIILPVGIYLKIGAKKRESELNRRNQQNASSPNQSNPIQSDRCPNCSNITQTAFCPSCGTKIPIKS